MKKYAVFIFVATFLLIFTGMLFKKPICEFSLNTLTSLRGVVSDCGKSIDNIFNKNNLVAENEALKKELLFYRKNNIDSEALKKENESLRSVLSLRNKTDYKIKTHATVCDILTQGDFLITVDKGKNQGVLKNDVAIWGEALVGRVCEVFDEYAHISPITAPNSSTGAKTENNDAGLVLGRLGLLDENACEFSPFSQDLKLNTGDFLVTSGLSDIYPEGLLIGKIEKNTDTITIKTEVDFFKIQTLTIVSCTR